MRVLIFLTIFILSIFTIYNKMNHNNSTLISRNILFGNPDKIRVTLSPDGKFISYLAPKEGVLNIWIAPTEDIKSAKCISDDKARGIRDYSWAYDNEHILYQQDNNGDENFRIYSYSISKNETTLHTAENGVLSYISGMSEQYHNLVLIATNERDKKYFDIYKLDLNDGSKKLVLENNRFSQVISDLELNLRFAIFNNAEGDKEYYQYQGNSWEPYIKIPFEDIETTSIEGFTKDSDNIYLLDSRGLNTSALKEVNIKGGGEKLLYSDAKTDLEIFTIHPTEKNIQAVVVNYEKPEIKVLDKNIEADINYLLKLDQGRLVINSRSQDDKLWLVGYINDTSPIKYYKYDRDNKKAEYLFSNRKDLENLPLSKMSPVVIKSRDGLDLVSYLTLPKDGAKKSPLVLLVHGGPWARDEWGFNTLHQWLSNRGYAVLSVNYRGSTGFGKNFINAANGEWGKKMHEDLIDAVNWAIEEKIADPKKIAIMGGSFGGYATLTAMTKSPDIFACGVDIVGMSNIETFIHSIPPYWTPYINILKKRIGLWESEEDIKKLKEISPINYVDNIKSPLLIAQGANDPRVKQAESDQIYNKMREKNIEVTYALFPEEGHGFQKPENRLAFYFLAEQFLAKYLGGRFEPGDNFAGANFTVNGK